jgi:hypothetical protein
MKTKDLLRCTKAERIHYQLNYSKRIVGDNQAEEDIR